MRILDANNVEITNPDLSLGYLKEEQILKQHHDEIKTVKEQGHHEVIRTYPNGGKDVQWVVDVPGVAGCAAWDEYETILRYVLYTQAELDAMNAPTQLDIIEAQVMYTAMMTDTLIEG